MENINYPFLIWAGFGVIGWFVLSRRPSKFLFDDLMITTMVTVLMAFLLPIWGGPIFLIVVLLMPNKKRCIHCKRVIPESEAICPQCQKSQDVLPSQLEIIVKQDEQRDCEFAELAIKYGKWDILVLPIFLVSAPLVGYISWLLMTKISDFRYAQMAQERFVFFPLHNTWIIIAMFVGIIGSAIPMYFFLRLVLGKQYGEYQKFQSMKSTGNTKKSGYIFFGISIILCFVTIVLMLDYYTVAYQDKLVLNQFWGLGNRQYSYSDITAISSSMQLKKSKWDHPIYVIEFDDGFKWSTRWDINERNPKEVGDFFAYVAKQSRLEIKSIPAFTDNDIR